MSKANYRAEIDGLRAFALAAVIINHFNKELLPSGYLGVDVFFVISGYVITSSLAGRECHSFADFISSFYGRRLKRLVPALVFFVLVCGFLICLVDPSPGQSLQTGIYSLFGLSNLYLFNQSTDYFAQATELNPFTHTWSLGVEEQFYLLFPLLIWFSGFARQTKNSAKTLFVWISSLAVASLLAFLVLYQINQPAAYFLMPTRFWEMAAGCILFIAFQKRQGIEQLLERVPPSLVVLAMIAVMLLPLSAAVPATLAIALLSGMLLACLKPGSVVFQIFTAEKVVFVGLISYSLYLWHWGVLSLSRWTIGVHWWSVPIQLVIMVLMAMISYILVEAPIRYRQVVATKAVIPAGIALVSIASFLLGSLTRLGSSLFLKRVYDIESFPAAYPVKGKPFDLTCILDGRQRLYTAQIFSDCTVDAAHPELPSLWVFGDSHAGHLNGMLEELYRRYGVGYHLVETPGLPYPQTKRRKLREREWIFDQAAAKMKANDVLLLSRIYVNRNTEQVAVDFDDWWNQVRMLAHRVNKRGVRVVVMMPTPLFSLDSKSCNSSLFSRLSPACSQSRLSYNRIFGIVIQRLRELPLGQQNLAVFDPIPTLCDVEALLNCSIHSEGKLLFRDRDHLNVFGSAKLADSFAHQFFKSLPSKPR